MASDTTEPIREAVDFNRVVDLGAGTDPDPRATVTADLHAPADHTVDLNEEWPWPAASVDGLIAHHVVEHLNAGHVLDEACRVLQDNGWLEIALPIGQDFDTDMATPAGHRPENRAEWHKPLIWVGKHNPERRPWDPERPLSVTDRSVALWTHKPGIWGRIDQWRIDRWLDRYGPGRWCFDWPMTSGEYVIHYQREARP